jgi:hypothetical protein
MNAPFLIHSGHSIQHKQKYEKSNMLLQAHFFFKGEHYHRVYVCHNAGVHIMYAAQTYMRYQRIGWMQHPVYD